MKTLGEELQKARSIVEAHRHRALGKIEPVSIDAEGNSSADVETSIESQWVELEKATRILQRCIKDLSKEKPPKKARKAVQAGNKIARLHLQLAQLLLLQSKFDEAKRSLKTASGLAQGEISKSINVTTASVLWNTDAFDDAVEIILNIIAVTEGDSDQKQTLLSERNLLLLMGICLEEDKARCESQNLRWRSRYRDYADQVFHEAYTKGPSRKLQHSVQNAQDWLDDAEPWLDLATACWDAGEVHLSIKAAIRGLYSPKGQQNAQLWRHLAQQYRMLFDIEHALEAATSAFHLDPFNFETRNLLTLWSPHEWGEYFAYEHRMVSKIQARVRSILARQKFRSILKDRQAHIATVRIVITQLWRDVRSCVLRRQIIMRHGYTKLQAQWRGVCTRKAMQEELKVRELNLRRTRMAKEIQRVYRGYRARLAYHISLHEIRRLRHAATQIQRIFRGHRIAKQASKLRKWHQSARKIQAIVRGKLVRSSVVRMREQRFYEIVIVPLTQMQALHRQKLVARGFRDACFHNRGKAEILKWNSIDFRASSFIGKKPLGQSGAQYQHGHTAPKIHALVTGTNAIASREALEDMLRFDNHIEEIGLSGVIADPLVADEMIWERVERGGLQNVRKISIQDSGSKYSDIRFAKSLLPRLLQASHLRTLDLGNMGLADMSCEALMSAFAGKPVLRRLGLEGNQISDRGAMAIVSIVMQGLEELDLRNNRISDQATNSLANAATCHLRSLHLADNFISELGALALRRLAKLGFLFEVSLYGNFISIRLCHEISNICADATLQAFHRPAPRLRSGRATVLRPLPTLTV